MPFEKAELGARSIPLNFPTPAQLILKIGRMPLYFLNLFAPVGESMRTLKRPQTVKPAHSARIPEMRPEFREACCQHQSVRERL